MCSWHKHIKVYDTCTEDEAAVSTSDEESWRFPKVLTHDTAGLDWRGNWNGKPSVFAVHKVVADFPSTSIHVMSLSFIFYNILSLKRDGVDSTRGGPLMRVVMLRRWELSVTLTMAKPYFFSFQLPTRAWSRSWKKSCFNHNLWQLWGKFKTSFTCNYPGLIDRMHKQASDSGLGRMRVAGDR